MKQVILNVLSIIKSHNLFSYEKVYLKFVISKGTINIFKQNQDLNEVYNFTSVIAKYVQLC